MSCLIKQHFQHERTNRLRRIYQVQPPVGKFNQPFAPSQPEKNIDGLNLHENHGIKINRKIGTMRALNHAQIRMQEH
jgi:hypothetical protein